MITAIASADAPRPLARELADIEPARPTQILAPTIAPTPPQQSLAPARLLIELDLASARFVQTMVDPSNDRVLRKFPTDGQIAFSRGIAAYATKTLGAILVRDA